MAARLKSAYQGGISAPRAELVAEQFNEACAAGNFRRHVARAESVRGKHKLRNEDCCRRVRCVCGPGVGGEVVMTSKFLS